MKVFAKAFINLEEIDKKRNLKDNQDYVDIINGVNESPKLSPETLNKFDAIWP